METDKPQAEEEEEEEPKPIPDMELAQRIYLLELAQTKPEFVPDAGEVKAQVLAQVRTLVGRAMRSTMRWLLGAADDAAE